MGTKDSVSHKHQIVGGYIAAAINKKVEYLDKEKFIATIMVKCRCERRKALEIINAHVEYNNFPQETKGGRKVFRLKNAK